VIAPAQALIRSDARRRRVSADIMARELSHADMATANFLIGMNELSSNYRKDNDLDRAKVRGSSREIQRV